ncbi:unnamed protein product [Oppiella nova]|uniref:MRG domain-containing protein n=1 Tax=Oppiella nova TaxID=334625 RepID=A0A7R9QBT3_9ACAR|nr:unnamed protein product [Oppiella nova]CAG2162777.1 unnamed protein product [Oppiella nova]
MSPNVSIGFDKPKPKPTNALGLATLPAISCETKENSIVLKEIEGQRKKRIKVETTLDSEVIISSRGPDVQIKIPESLKQCLVDDCDLMGLKKLVRLPSKVSVNRIVEDYVKHQLNTRLSPSKESAVREGAEAIKVYFNASIGTQLLYPFEKIQFKDLIKESDDDSKASAIYGGIHLLRLFVKLGSLLSYLNLDEKSSHLILDHIHDFLKYLERNPSLFTANEYESASAEYLKKSS